eukprot:953383_1
MAMQDMSTRVRKYVKALRESQILFRKYFGPRPEYRNKFEDEKVLQKVEKAVFSVVDVQKDQENIYLVVSPPKKKKGSPQNKGKKKRKQKQKRGTKRKLDNDNDDKKENKSNKKKKQR